MSFEPNRFEVTGEEYGVPVRVQFKRKSPALKYAERMNNTTIRDLETGRIIAGTSAFAQEYLNEQQISKVA